LAAKAEITASIPARSRTLALLRGAVIVQAAVFLASIYFCLYPFPFLDQIEWILGYLRDGFPSVFQAHNQHRLPIPRSLLILDLKLFRGASVVVPLAGLLALVVLAACLVRASRNFASATAPKESTMVGCVAILLLIRGYTIPDYVTASTIQFVLFLAFAALSLSAATQGRGVWQSTKAIAYGLAAAGCGASGLAVFPALAWISWRLWKNRLWALSLLAVTILLSVAYFHGMKLGGPVTTNPLPALKFVIEYFGVPWERMPITYPLAFLQGALIVGVLSVLIVRKTFRGSPSSPEAFLLALAIVLLATGLMTAFGRSSSVDLETQGSRYALVAATAQAIAWILLYRPLTRFIVERNLRPASRNAAVIALSIGLLGEQALATMMVHRRTAEMAEVKKHVCSGEPSKKDLKILYFSDPNRAAEFVEAIRNYRLYCGPY
jgi:hypothetical protein